ncbi:glycosyltransferase family 1 protein [Leptolyngbya sp. FACHB-261]|uniref:glycosyltransferase family 1 protein n=1 Tax=Leptolyngbya sp. FACHB-261 TaxID=2692806 RepID=UPI0016888B52|nr:glycosyltransferase family 1 protein [Leptolyngbya sp. FACHB-261]MBD2104246.1 glycosyltransferase family 1 protein [Leptolyngbya sp. FACHB-261]
MNNPKTGYQNNTKQGREIPYDLSRKDAKKEDINPAATREARIARMRTAGTVLRKRSQSLEKLESLPTDVPDLVCLSHLRWDFVYQRPQHLLSRCAQEQRVFFVEEPIFGTEPGTRIDISRRDNGVWVVVPHLHESLQGDSAHPTQQQLLDQLFAEREIEQPILWYYTPMALPFSRHLQPSLVVYDCMDELSAFKGAPPILRELEAELFERANLVFTGGQTLYEAKREQHANVHAFPSSVDVPHFAQARTLTEEPADQASIPHPRIGFYGVIDERMDLDLLRGVAEARPEWHLVIIGPVVKIDQAQLPRLDNIHYLGGKAYTELPQYLAGWDVAMLPFARNESTRFISPTKTPEYLAAGRPVVSTSIRDVVCPYGQSGLAEIADTVPEFVAAVEMLLSRDPQASGWLPQVDQFLSQISWDRTWNQMAELMGAAMGSEQLVAKAKTALRSSK